MRTTRLTWLVHGLITHASAHPSKFQGSITSCKVDICSILSIGKATGVCTPCGRGVHRRVLQVPESKSSSPDRQHIRQNQSPETPHLIVNVCTWGLCMHDPAMKLLSSEVRWVRPCSLDHLTMLRAILVRVPAQARPVPRPMVQAMAHLH